MLASVFLALLQRSFAFPVQGDRPENLVDLGYAKYQGHTNGAGIKEFLGMRYAAPPTGNLRFRAPADPNATSIVQDASAFGPTCFGPGGYSASTGEDCLFINVFAPADATAASKLPVWFYIQGGGFAANSNANYNGELDEQPARVHLGG